MIYCRILYYNYYIYIRCLHIYYTFSSEIIPKRTRTRKTFNNGIFLKAGSSHPYPPPKKHLKGIAFSASRSPSAWWFGVFGIPPINAPPKIAVHMEGFLNPPKHFPRRCGLLGRVLVPVRESKRNVTDSCSGSHAFHFSGKNTCDTLKKRACVLFLESEENLRSQNRWRAHCSLNVRWLVGPFLNKGCHFFKLKPRLGYPQNLWF